MFITDITILQQVIQKERTAMTNQNSSSADTRGLVSSCNNPKCRKEIRYRDQVVVGIFPIIFCSIECLDATPTHVAQEEHQRRHEQESTEGRIFSRRKGW